MSKGIGIVGSRRRDKFIDLLNMKSEFFKIYEEGDWIISGGCRKGGDRFAEIIAREYGIPIIIYHANWKKYGKQAGFRRNGQIAKQANILMACVASDRTGGTEDTIKKFQKYHLDGKVVLV